MKNILIKLQKNLFNAFLLGTYILLTFLSQWELEI